MQSTQVTGHLYIVATPIGHLDDITLRAADVLKSVQIIAAEDTRRSRILLNRLGAEQVRMISLHEHNEEELLPQLLDKMQSGIDVALVSDAGTPLICDPGFKLVRAAWDRGIQVLPVPGCSAIMAAVSICPLPVDRFYFEGFLPAKASQRVKRLQSLAASIDVALVFFESPRRILACLEDLITVVGKERRIMIGRELTKIHETVTCGPVLEVLAQLNRNESRGEFVCVLEAPAAQPNDMKDVRELVTILSSELKPSQAARLAAKYTGMSRARLYALAQSVKSEVS